MILPLTKMLVQSIQLHAILGLRRRIGSPFNKVGEGRPFAVLGSAENYKRGF